MSVSKIYTENPFVDELVYYVKQIAPNCIIKNETEADANETVTSLQTSDLYIACYEGRALYELIPQFPIDVLAQAGVPQYLREDYHRHKDHIPEVYHKPLTTAFMPYYVEHYEEQNNYYRMLLGLPKYKDENDLFYLSEEDIPKGLIVDTTIPIHLQSTEIIAALDAAGVLEKIVEENPIHPYLKFIGKNIDLYQARIAIRFQLLYMPSCGSDIIDAKFRNKFDINRDYILHTVYSDAFKFQSKYYDNIITILIVIQTMIDVINEVQENIARKDVFDARCIKYIFQSYGVPFYDEIPIKYQIKMMKNLNRLLKYKSTPTCMLDLCSIFGFDSVNIFKYYLLRNRKFDDKGEYVFIYEKDQAVYKDTTHPVKVMEKIVKSDDGIQVTIPYPFAQYKDKGNDFRVFVNDYIIYEGTSGNTYFINGDICVFNQPEILKYDIIARYDLTLHAIEQGYELKPDGLYLNDKIYYSMAEVFVNFDLLLKDNIFEENENGDIYKYQTEERLEYSYKEPTIYRNIKFIFYYTDNEDPIEPIDTTDYPIITKVITATVSESGMIENVPIPEGFTRNNGLINITLNSFWLHPDQYNIISYNPLNIAINFYDASIIAGHEAVILFIYTNKYNIHPQKKSQEQDKDSSLIKIPAPIPNYSSAGHEFFATYGGTLLSPDRYYINNDSLQMIDPLDIIAKKRDINYNFMYIDHEDPVYIIIRQKITIGLGQRSFIIDIPTKDSKSRWEVYDDQNDPLIVENPKKYNESAYEVWSRLGVNTIQDYVKKLYQIYVIHGEERFYDYQYDIINNNTIIFTDSAIPLEEGTELIIEFRVPRDPENTDIFKKDMYKVSFMQTTYDKQRIFQMNWPYNKFIERGNKFYVQIHGKILDPKLYDLNLTTNTLTIFSVKDALNLNDQLVVFYYYRRMNEFNIVFKQTTATAINDDSNEFIITFPFGNYLQSGNGFFVTVGGLLVDPTRYDIIETETETTLVFKPEYELGLRYDLKENFKDIYTIDKEGLHQGSELIASWYDIAESFDKYDMFEENENGIVYSYHSIQTPIFRLSYDRPILTPIIGKGRKVIFNFIYHSIFVVNANYVNSETAYVNARITAYTDNTITIPYPYPNFLEDPDSYMHVSIGTHVIEPVHYDISDGKIYIDNLKALLEKYETNQIRFDFIHSKASVYEVLNEVKDKSYNLLFLKAPLDGNLDDYMRNDENYLDYNTLTSGDKLWRGDNTAEFVQKQIMQEDFTYMRTKYISIDDIQNMAKLFLDLPYFFNLFFDNVKLENRLTVQLYSIKPGMNFRLNDVFVFMIIMAFEYNNIVDTITVNLAGVLYLRGFNFKADIPKLKKDIEENSFHHEYITLNQFNVWANIYNYIYTDDGVVQLNMDNYSKYLGKTVGMDKYNDNYLYGKLKDDPPEKEPEWHKFLDLDNSINDFIIPTQVIPTYAYLLKLYTTDKDIMSYITERMFNANNKHVYDMYKKIYDSILKLKYSREFFVNAQGTGYCDTYSEFLQYRNSVLFNVVSMVRLMEDGEKQAYILNIMESVIKEISAYLDSDAYNNLFTKFPGSNTDAVKTYIKLMINFFKSYKVDLTGINTIFTLNNKAENSVRPIDVINKMKSILEPRTDVILQDDSKTKVTATKKDIINIDDMIYMYSELTITDENIDDCYGKHLVAYYENDTLNEVMPYIVLTKTNIVNYINKRVKLKIH